MTQTTARNPGTGLAADTNGYPCAGRKIKARFTPHRTDDLQDEMRPFVGQVCDWECQGTLDDDTPFPGQWMWCHIPTYWWAPDQDLELALTETARVK